METSAITTVETVGQIDYSSDLALIQQNQSDLKTSNLGIIMVASVIVGILLIKVGFKK